ncbi:hypothetical protein AAIH70_25950 [Neorhizobium sp. BT27B]|uniref:hypothetical protein n=1 Tax=Neorhizobium sp. BT27B TaxID=3142625 RepID=UPI003D2CBBD0
MDLFNNPEPVPPASQMAVLPFLAGVQGLLSAGRVDNLQLTIHRLMYREGQEFLQQVCPYLPLGAGADGAGRVFSVNTGIMGAAYDKAQLFRTRYFEDEQAFIAARSKDASMKEDAKRSWLAIPLLGPDEQVVLILYATCETLNFFSDDARIHQIVAMAKGFCLLHDFLQESPFTNLRNFPLLKGKPNRDGGGLHKVQETVDIELPRFKTLSSFNYEAAAA